MARDLKLQVILDAVDKATRPLRAIQRQTETASTAIKEQRQRLKQLQTVQKDISSFKTLKNQSVQTGQALREQQDRIRRLSQQMQQNQGDTQQLAAERRKAIEQARKLSQRYSDEQQKLQRLRSTLNQSGVDTRQLGQAQQHLDQQVSQANAEIDEQKRKLQQLAAQQRRARQASDQFNTSMGRVSAMRGAGMSGIATGGAALYGGARMLSSGVDWFEQMSAVQAVGRFKADDERFKALKAQSRDLGSSTAFSATEVGSGQEFLLRAGMSADAIKSSMKDVLDLALANNTELGRTADIASNIAGGFKIDLEQAGGMQRVADVLSGTASRANVDLEMLGETMKYLGAGSDLGLTLEEAGAMAGLLGNIGIQGSQAGTTMRAMMDRLTKPTAAAAGVMDDLGLKIADAEGNMRPMPEILRDINAATAGMGNVQRKAQLQELFGAEAGSGMAELVNQMSTGQLDKLIDNLSKSYGENAEMASVMADNIGGDLKGLRSAWEEIGISITDTNEGALRDLVQSITDITRAVGNWIKENPELAGTIFKIAAGVAALVAAGGALTIMMASLLGPIVTVRYGLAMLGLRTEGVGGRISQLTRRILPALGKAMGWMGGILRTVSIHIYSLATRAIPMMGKALVGLGRGFIMLAGAIGRAGLALLANPMTWIILGIVAAVAALAGAAYLIYKNWGAITEFFGNLWESIKSGASTAWEAITSAIANAWQAIKNHIAGQWEAFSALPGQLATIGGNIIDGLIGGITGKYAALKEKILGMARGIKSWFADALGINSPSRVFAEFGGWTVEGLMDGLKSKLSSLKDSVVGIASSVTSWFKEKLDIHSPSRVFAALGGHTVDGLTLGLERQRDEPARRITDIANRARQAGAGLALGAMALPAAAMPSITPSEPIRFDTRPPLASQTAGSSYQDNSTSYYTITINAPPGSDEHAIAKAVSRELDRRERERSARQRSSMWDRE